MDGWIKLYRKMVDCCIWQSNEPFDKRSAWVDLLLLMQHKDKKMMVDGVVKSVKRGSYMFSIDKLASRWRWSRNKVKRYLSELESEQMLYTERTKRGTLITVVNYVVYQGCEKFGEPSDEPSDEPQNKNIKNVRSKERKKYICAFEEFWKIYPRKINKGKAYECYCARVNSGYSEAELLEAVRNYADECKKKGTPTEYIKHGTTFLSAATPFVDYLDKNYKGGNDGCNRQDNRQSDGGYSDYEKFFREAH